ncbi:MAG: hypothetical protein P9L94_14350 [Candidatus Hinthialibacter antarcticus]|nr:hypothetical protein [Candidatus Hinthialibacter antarcticus]
MQLDFFNNSSYSIEIFIYTLLAISVVIAATVYGNNKYQWFQKISRFRDEMHSLQLGAADEALLSDLVRRYMMKEPSEALASLPLFDELAQKEIQRVLSSPGSSEAKEDFVKRIYEIRQKAFFPEWVTN